MNQANQREACGPSPSSSRIRHAWAEQVRIRVRVIEKDLHGDTLNDLHEVAGRVLRRQQRELRPGAALEAVDVPMQPEDWAEGIDGDGDWLANPAFASAGSP